MNMSLLVLDGPLKGEKIPLKKDYVFRAEDLQDSKMHKEHAVLSLDQNFHWKISCLDDAKIRMGLEEKQSISIIPELIFNLGQTGFKVLIREPSTIQNRDEELASFVSKDIWQPVDSVSYFLLNPIQITVLQGTQAGESMTASYGPRIFGYNQLDLNLKDPNFPHDFLRFRQVGDEIWVDNLTFETDAPIQVVLNQTELTSSPLIDGDLIKFGTNILQISYLK